MKRLWVALPLVAVAFVAQAAPLQHRAHKAAHEVSLITKVKNWIASKFASTQSSSERAKSRTQHGATANNRASTTTGRIVLSTGTPSASKFTPTRAATADDVAHRTHAPPASSASNRVATAPDRLALATTTSDLPVLRSLQNDGCSGKRIIAAYYWQGSHTASGERFNPNGLSAAHRTLPFGTQLTVSNPRTRKSVDVVVNDRGPFVRGVTLDLSLGAAKAIGMTGTGPVCIR